MQFRNLGNSDIKISELCLGTMTWGSQNTEREAHQQVDMALMHGVNFIDTAEMYPTTPISAETCGHTEQMLGSWIKKSGRRKDIVLATKVVGVGFSAIRDGGPISKQAIDKAVIDSLQRLHTDYIDLYQLHWPNRGSYHFRGNWNFAAHKQSKNTAQDILQLLEALQPHLEAGRIRQIGLSNESAWGTMKFLEIAKQHTLPAIISVQNEYNLMCRLYDLDMAELTQHEGVGLLSYSPLAAGLLTGKYYAGAVPEKSRAVVSNKTLHGRISALSQPVADAYVNLAHNYQLDPAQMALAFCCSRPFMNSTIIGATNLEQLENNLNAVNVHLSTALLDEIQQLYRSYPMPM